MPIFPLLVAGLHVSHGKSENPSVFRSIRERSAPAIPRPLAARCLIV